MYIEQKQDGLRGPARIGRVSFSKTGKTLYYAGRTLEPLKGRRLKANYFDADSGDEFWISGPRTDGLDSLYGATVEIDEDCRKEYWRDIRGKRELASNASYKSPGRSKKERDGQEKAVRRRKMDGPGVPAWYRPTPRRDDFLKDKAVLSGFDVGDNRVFMRALDLSEYWDESHPVIDEPKFRRDKCIRKLYGTLYDSDGEEIEHFCNDYDEHGALRHSGTQPKDGTE
jgi:hypothetical protein